MPRRWAVDWTPTLVPSDPGVAQEPEWAGWYGASYGDGEFVLADGWDGRVARSADGVTWAQSWLSDAWRGVGMVAWGAGTYVAIAAQRGTLVATSPDGVVWTDGQLAIPAVEDNGAFVGVTSDDWSDVIYADGKFVALGYFRFTSVSTDGLTWTGGLIPYIPGEYERPRAEGDDPLVPSWGAVAFGNGTFVAVGDERIASSPDGINWTVHHQGAAAGNHWSGVAFGNGVFVAVGYSPGPFTRPYDQWSTDTYATSPDGITWTQRKMPSVHKWQAVTFGGEVFVVIAGQVGSSNGAVRESNADVYAASEDGIFWTEGRMPTTRRGTWSHVVFGDGVFFASPNSSTTAATGIARPLDGGYVRMNQRDDGRGVERHPRLSGTNSNTPSSLQRSKAPRLGASNTYR
jgi:hypothetical protein